MDVTISPGPVLAYSPPADGGHFITDYHWWLETLGNFALLGSGGAVFQRGRIFSTSFKLHPALSKAATLVLPFGIFVEKPGLLHFALDVGFYKGAKPAFELIDSQYRQLREWLDTVDEQSLLNALGPAGYDLLTAAGTVKNINVIVEMPPAWLTDP